MADTRPAGGVWSFLRREAPFLAAVVAGTWLRLDQLGTQIIADDEWHALYELQRLSTFDILRHFGFSDACIPLTFYYKVASASVGVSEWVMRAPALAAGVASLIVFPLLVRRHSGRSVSTVFAWLLAVSPIHVYFSRYARPYDIALFCTFVATMALYTFWITRRRGWKWTYVGCAVLAPYFHLSTLPLVVVPLALAVAIAVRRGGNRQAALPARELAGIALALGAGFLLLLGPPFYSDWMAVRVKIGQRHLADVALAGGFQLLLGVGRLWLAAAVLLVVGAVILARRTFTLWAYLVVLLATQAVVLVVTRPDSIQDAIIVARYALSSLPLVLWMVAAGLAAVGDALRTRWRPIGPLPAIAWVVAATLAGPLPRIDYAPNNWTNHGVFQYFPSLDPSRNRYANALEPRRMPAFYTDLGRLGAGRLRLVEAPWYYEWHRNPYPFYQRVHRQETLIGFVDDEAHPTRRFARTGERDSELPLGDGRFRFSRFVHVADPAALCAARVDRVVFHRDLRQEPRLALTDREVPIVARRIGEYRQRYGAPVYEDPTIVVFDVTRGCGQP